MTRPRIYYAAAVRAGANFDALAARIAKLDEFCEVLTAHMASPVTVDGGRSDAAIHAHDQELLARADCLIADVTAPSTGTGYMIGRAIARRLPVLCLYATGTRPSAMIAGSPDVTTRFYADEAAAFAHMRAFVQGAPRIYLAGPPGSGKGMLGKVLAERTGLPHISTGELLRALVKNPDHPHAATISAHMTAGKLVPAEIMRDIVRERLAACAHGFILDGYPPSRADLANLDATPPDLVLELMCSEATSIVRQVGRKARATDTPDTACERYRVFATEHADFASWYPGRLVARLDAEQSPDVVLTTALEIVRRNFALPSPVGSYHLVPGTPARSTRLHFHIDARDHATVRAMAHEVHRRHPAAQGQVKIYPIDALCLGPQHDKLAIYRRMPNFHPIAPSDREAFATGRLGDGDRALVEVVLAVTRDMGGMAEVEEYVGEWTLGSDGAVATDARYELLPIDHKYPDHTLCADIPRWELHHGFDIPRTEPPLALPELVARSAAAGLTNGGWFVFANECAWAYRTNEFSDASQAECETMLVAQARALQRIAGGAPVSFSLERVHGIWVY